MKTNKTIIKSFSAACIAVAGALLGMSAHAQSGSIYQLSSNNAPFVDETFEVTVFVDPDVEQLSVVDLHMYFDPAYLEVLSITPITDGIDANVINPSFDNQSGTVTLSAFNLGGTISSAVFALMQINFRALAPTVLTSIAHPQDVFPKTIMAYGGESVLSDAETLDISIQASETLSSLDFNEDGLGMTLWPNPASDHTFVQFTTAHLSQATLELIDISGRSIVQVFRGSATPNIEHRFELDVEHLPAGLYFVRLQANSGQLVKKLVITN